MSKLVFRPEDFKGKYKNWLNIDETLYSIAFEAQSKFDAWLKESGKVVWSDTKVDPAWQPWHNVEIADATHKAILVCIQKIEPEHKHEFKCSCGDIHE